MMSTKKNFGETKKQEDGLASQQSSGSLLPSTKTLVTILILTFTFLIFQRTLSEFSLSFVTSFLSEFV